jgi:hypothetical protein
MKKKILCIVALLMGSLAICPLEAKRGGASDRLVKIAALAKCAKLIRKERAEHKRQQAVLTGEIIDAEGKLPWAFHKLFEVLKVSESKIKLAEKRYVAYLKTRDTYRKKRDDMRERLVELRDKNLTDRNTVGCLKACNAIVKLDDDFWKAYNRNYANMLGAIDNYLSSKQRLAWPATSLLAESLSHFTKDERAIFTDKVFNAKIEAISKEAKTIAKLNTYTERIHKRKTLYDAICKEFKLRQFRDRKEDKDERREEKRKRKKERKEERKESKEEPNSKSNDGFGGW